MQVQSCIELLRCKVVQSSHLIIHRALRPGYTEKCSLRQLIKLPYPENRCEAWGNFGMDPNKTMQDLLAPHPLLGTVARVLLSV